MVKIKTIPENTEMSESVLPSPSPITVDVTFRMFLCIYRYTQSMQICTHIVFLLMEFCHIDLLYFVLFTYCVLRALPHS